MMRHEDELTGRSKDKTETERTYPPRNLGL